MCGLIMLRIYFHRELYKKKILVTVQCNVNNVENTIPYIKYHFKEALQEKINC